jgi:hypothetical protein
VGAGIVLSTGFNSSKIENCFFVGNNVCILYAGTQSAGVVVSTADNCLMSVCNYRIGSLELQPFLIRNWQPATTVDCVITNSGSGYYAASNIKPQRVLDFRQNGAAASSGLTTFGVSSNNLLVFDNLGNITNVGGFSFGKGTMVLNQAYTYTTNLQVYGAGIAGVNGNYYITNAYGGANYMWTNAATGYYLLVDNSGVNIPDGAPAAFFNSARVGQYVFAQVTVGAGPTALTVPPVLYDFSTNNTQGWSWDYAVGVNTQPMPGGAYINVFATPSVNPTLGVNAVTINSNSVCLGTNPVVNLGTASVAIDFAKPSQLIITNASFLISGALNVPNTAGSRPYSEFWVSNSAAANITITTAGYGIEKPYSVNPISSLVVTAGSVARIEARCYPNVKTNLWFVPAQ